MNENPYESPRRADKKASAPGKNNRLVELGFVAVSTAVIMWAILYLLLPGMD